MFKKVRVEDSIGTVLAHDLTKIVPGEFKGCRFKKGHVIAAGDLPELLQMGKEHLYVLELGPGDVHEDEAALRLARAAIGANGGSLLLSEPREGKVNLTAAKDGLLKVDYALLEAVNANENIMLATLHNNYPVRAGQLVAGTRIIPLTIAAAELAAIEERCAGQSLLAMRPYLPLRVGLITTGSEVYKGRIKDAFGPVVRAKVEVMGSKVAAEAVVPDDAVLISAAIRGMLDQGLDMVLLTGGMSVDPDDVTPEGIRLSGARVVSYGAPVLPGAMFMLAYREKRPILGLPGCVMYFKTTIFDLVLPRLLAGEELTRADIVRLAAGGLCQGCAECRYPACPFGKA